MPFQLHGIDEALKENLKTVLETQNFPELYKSYSWNNDTYANGFPDIYCLETRLISDDQTDGISLADVKRVADWGKLRNPGRIQGKAIVLNPRSLHSANGFPISELDYEPLNPLMVLQKNIIQGIGPTYFSKILRFGLPNEYGAIDTRCVRVFGKGDTTNKKHDWLNISARNNGYGWYIPENQAGWPHEYAKWINILRYFSLALRDKCSCPHPPNFVTAGLRESGVWGCADVEMALFASASKIIDRETTKAKKSCRHTRGPR